ncbi:MAG: large conductance mechanosensitive channel protein MscL [Sciscionella sp.]
MLKGFKEFLTRGNVIDLAIAVIMGTAFTAIITAVTNSLVKPLINSIGSAKVNGFGFRITEDKSSTYIDLAEVINAVLNFVIIAAIVYFALVLPMRKIKERRLRNTQAQPSAPTDVELLGEIRDLLQEQNNHR